MDRCGLWMWMWMWAVDVGIPGLEACSLLVMFVQKIAWSNKGSEPRCCWREVANAQRSFSGASRFCWLKIRTRVRGFLPSALHRRHQ